MLLISLRLVLRRAPQLGRPLPLGALFAVCLAVVAGCVEEDTQQECSTGEILDTFADPPLCVPEACGLGPWGPAAADADFFVVPWGSSGGDGSADSPWGSIEAGLDAVAQEGGGQVAIAAGVYPENLLITEDHDGLELRGRCTSEVVLDGSAAAAPGIKVEGGSVVIRGLTVTGGEYGVKVDGLDFDLEPFEVELREVVLDANSLYGLVAFGLRASIELREVVISDTVPDLGLELGRGIEVLDSAKLDAEDLLVSGNHVLGILVEGTGIIAPVEETSVELVRTTIRDTQPGAFSGRGLEVSAGASMVGSELLIEQNSGYGLVVGSPGTEVELDSVVIRDTLSSSAPETGRGIEVQLGATLTASDLLIERSVGVGLLVGMENSLVQVDGFVVRETLPRPEGTQGRAVVVQDDSTFSGTDVLLEDNHEIAFYVEGEGTSADLHDATIRGTRAPGKNPSGRALDIGAGAHFVGSDLLIEDNERSAVYVGGEGTTAELQSSTVRDTRASSDGSFGRGISVEEGGSLVASGLLIEGNRDAGLAVAHPGSSLVLQDSIIRDTQPWASGTFGLGLAVQDEAHVVASDVLIEESYGRGVFVSDPGTLVELEDVVVRDTWGQLDGATGVGVIAQLEGTIEAERLDVSLSAGPGLWSIFDANLHCVDCVVSESTFAGAMVYDAALYMQGGRIEDSVRSVDQGGGVGLFAWGSLQESVVRLDGVEFSGHPGPALYFRGPGSYEVLDSVIEDSAWAEGVLPVPGAVVAVDGVPAWQPATEDSDPFGLLLADTLLSQVPTHGILLDASSATVEALSFDGVEGFELYQQRCTDALGLAEVLGGALLSNECEGSSNVVEPMLWWTVELGPMGL